MPGGAKRALRQVLALLMAWALVSTARQAHAAGCGSPDLVEAFPSAGSLAVPTNAHLWARYAATAVYLGEPVVLERLGGERREVLAQFSANEGLLVVEPEGFLEAGGRYRVEWPRLRGSNTASQGNGFSLEFSVGQVTDALSPVFGGAQAVEFRLERSQDGCSGTVEERFLFELAVGSVEDETQSSDLALLVFQVSGDGPPVQVHAQRYPDNGRVTLARPVRQATGSVCFAALVRDLTGKVSASADRVACTTTAEPPFFYGCELAPTARTPNAFGLLGLGLLGLLGYRWRALGRVSSCG
jgi:hypothetical protein